MTFSQHPFRTLLAFVAFMTLLRLLSIGHFGLGVDEAHYVLYGLRPDLSYFDHPPLVGWTQAAFTTVFGSDPFGARLAAVLIGAVVSLQSYYWLRQMFTPVSALVGVAALNAAFLFNALFMMLMPDTLLFVLVFPIMATALRIEQEDRLRDWWLLGLLLGLAGLSKYTAFLFVISLVLYFALQGRRDVLLSPKMVLAIMTAAVVVSPVFIWNLQHDWISFTFQSNHVAGHGGVNLTAFGQSLAAQFGAYNPLLVPLAFFGLYRALRTPTDHARFMTGLFGAVILTFFTYNSLYARALPHWTALFYLLFIPIGTVLLFERGGVARRYGQWAIGLGLVLVLLVHVELRFKFIPFPDYRSVHRDLYGWDQIMQRAGTHLNDPVTQGVAVLNWSLASRAIYYGGDLPVYLLDHRYDQFDLWQQRSPEGKDLLVIQTHDFTKALQSHLHCDALETAEAFDLTLNGYKVNHVTLTWCRNYRAVQER